MIRNLLSNAVKYTARGKDTARLPAPRRQSAHRGLGYRTRNPGRELQAIFEEFHQLDNPARERSRGLGLGLSIVQRLADLLGHRSTFALVSVRARVFTIEVPLGRDQSGGQCRFPAGMRSRTEHTIARHGPDHRGRSGRARNAAAAFRRRGTSHSRLPRMGTRLWSWRAQRSTVPDLIVADYNLPKRPQRTRDHREAAKAGSARRSRPSS